MDFYHALEHAGRVLAALIGKDHPDYQTQWHRGAKQLLKDRVRHLIDQSRPARAGQPAAAAVENEPGDFMRNVRRMQQGTFGAKGCFIGAGVVEAGCTTLIGGRCKQPGMFGSETGAQTIRALRCLRSSRRLGEFWKHRLNERAARNDPHALSA